MHCFSAQGSKRSRIVTLPVLRSISLMVCFLKGQSCRFSCAIEVIPPCVYHRLCQIFLFGEAAEDVRVHRVLHHQVDVGASVPLADSVNSGEALAVGGVVEIDRVIYASVGGCQGDAGASRVDLADEYHRGGVCLELLDDGTPALLGDFAVDRYRLHAVLREQLFRQLLDLMDFREEPGEDDQLLFTLDYIVLKDIGEGIQLAGADQLRFRGIVLHQEPPGELLEPEQFGEDGGGGDRAAV